MFVYNRETVGYTFKTKSGKTATIAGKLSKPCTVVDDAVWDEIVKEFGDTPALVHGIIYGAKDDKEAAVKAKDLDSIEKLQNQKNYGTTDVQPK